MAFRRARPRRIFSGQIFYFAKVFSFSTDAQNYAGKQREHGKLARVTSEPTQRGKRYFVWIR